MINFADVTEYNIKEHNPDGPHIAEPLYKILIIDDLEPRKTHIA